MINKLSSSIFLHDYVNRKGLSKLYMQIIIKRKTRRYPLEIFIEPDNWDQRSSKVTKRQDKHILNRIIINEMQKVNSFYLSMREIEDVSFDNFDKLYYNIDHTKISYVIELHCQNISKDSKKVFITVQKQINILFGDISINTFDFTKINKYHHYIKHLSHNTIWARHKVLKTLINTAIKHDIYKQDNPYKLFTWKYIQPVRIFLTKDEIQKIENILIKENVPDRIKYYARAFLFQAYTSLRYSDIKRLKHQHIQSNSLVLQTKKTSEIVYIPIITQAQAILSVLRINQEFVFKIPTNQKYNEALKLVGAAAGISKVLSSHVARHSFAVISIENGIPIEIIGKLMGHTKIQTTQIYAKIMNPVLDAWMEKWNK